MKRIKRPRYPIVLVGLLLLLVFSTIALTLLIQPFVRPIASAPPPVDPAQLEHHVQRLSLDFYPRSADQRSNLERAAQYVQATFQSFGVQASRQEFSLNGERFSNISARFGPAQGALLVIGAHYDSYGDAYADDGYSPETHTPGADDNASGVAGLLELARLLADAPPRRPVELVAYTLEEPPYFRSEHMGSVQHARRLRREGRQVELMISLEMIGYFSDAPESQAYPFAGMSALYPKRGNFIALVGRFGDFATMRNVKALMAGATDLPVYSINAPATVPGIDFSDHANYWNEGYPALMVTDTAFYRNPHYHQAQDTFETLDYQRMAKVVQAVFAIAQHPQE